MYNAWLIARLDLQIFLRSRGNLLQLMLIPVILTLVVGHALGGSGGEPQRIRLDLLDEDRSGRSAQLAAVLLAQGPALRLCPVAGEDCDGPVEASPSLATALERVRQGAADALLHIPPGFDAALAAQEPVMLPFYTTAAVPQTDPAWNAVQAALQRVNGVTAAGITGAELHAALALAQEGRADYVLAVQEFAADAWAERDSLVRVTQTAATASESTIPGGFTQSVPGMATFYVLFSVMGGGISVLIRERREGTLARMATLPLRRSEVIGGKILARFITGILQFLIVFAVGAATGLDFGRSPLALVLLMASYTLAITALGLVLGSRLKNEEQTAMLAIVLAALGGAWWPLSIAPQFMQTLGRLTPVAWAMDGFQQLISRGGGLEDVLLHLAILSGFALVFFMLGLRNFRFN